MSEARRHSPEAHVDPRGREAVRLEALLLRLRARCERVTEKCRRLIKEDDLARRDSESPPAG